MTREQLQTIRQQIIDLLDEEAHSARDISQIVRIPEKEVAGHLEHIANSIRNRKKKLITEPCRCLDCGFTFADRKRLTKPGRCPECRGSHIQPPLFFIK